MLTAISCAAGCCLALLVIRSVSRSPNRRLGDSEEFAHAAALERRSRKRKNAPDRRSEPRYSYKRSDATAGLMGDAEGRAPCRIEDISPSGMRIALRGGFPLAAQVCVQWSNEFFIGSVCYAMGKDGEYVLGLRLISCSYSRPPVLPDFLKRCARRAAGFWRRQRKTEDQSPLPELRADARLLRSLPHLGDNALVEPAKTLEQPELRLIDAGGQTLVCWEWAGEDPPLLFAHATGFHGRCWDTIIRQLPGRRRIAVDFRGHGRSSKPAPPYLWKNFGRDLAHIAEHLNIRGAIGIGHSMGGHSTVCAAALRPETYAALLLIDPTIFPENLYGTEPPDAAFILRRRNAWSGPDEMFERFRERLPFVRWSPEVLRDYCDFGLLQSQGEFVLACPPEVEAAIYAQSKTPESNPYREIASIRQPVTVLRAGTTRDPAVFDLSASPTAIDLASYFMGGRDVLLPESSHYIAMEVPERVIAEIRQIALMA